VGVGEEVVVGADDGGGFAGAPVDGDVLAEDVAVADDDGGRFAVVFEVLGALADGGEGVEFVLLADGGVAVDDDVAVEFAAITEGDVGIDHTKGADFDIGPEICFGRNDRAWMNHGGGSNLDRGGVE